MFVVMGAHSAKVSPVISFSSADSRNLDCISSAVFPPHMLAGWVKWSISATANGGKNEPLAVLQREPLQETVVSGWLVLSGRSFVDELEGVFCKTSAEPFIEEMGCRERC